MGTAMYRPYVCRAKLGGERSVNCSERSQCLPADEVHICVVMGLGCSSHYHPVARRGGNAAVRQQ